MGGSKIGFVRAVALSCFRLALCFFFSAVAVLVACCSSVRTFLVLTLFALGRRADFALVFLGEVVAVFAGRPRIAGLPILASAALVAFVAGASVDTAAFFALGFLAGFSVCVVASVTVTAFFARGLAGARPVCAFGLETGLSAKVLL